MPGRRRSTRIQARSKSLEPSFSRASDSHITFQDPLVNDPNLERTPSPYPEPKNDTIRTTTPYTEQVSPSLKAPTSNITLKNTTISLNPSASADSLSSVDQSTPKKTDLPTGTAGSSTSEAVAGANTNSPFSASMSGAHQSDAPIDLVTPTTNAPKDIPAHDTTALEEEIENEILLRIKNRSFASSNNEQPLPTAQKETQPAINTNTTFSPAAAIHSDQFIPPPNDTVTLSLSRLENKLDLFLMLQQNSIESSTKHTLLLESISKRLDIMHDHNSQLHTHLRSKSDYNEHFKKMTSLFDRTISSISSLESKLDAISNKISSSQPPSSGISFDSSIDEPPARPPLSANKTTVSFPSNIHSSHHAASHTNPPAFSSHQPSTGSNDSPSINDNIVAILDKLVESKSTKSPTNLAFPSFSGSSTSTPFNRWSTVVCGILATSEWSKLYCRETNSYVLDGSVAPILNNHLYSALLVKLKSPAADYAASRKDLHGDGVGLLEALRHAYRNVLTPSDLIVLTQKFQNHSRPSDQPIETFATELQSMYHDIIENGGHTTKEDLKHYFIYNLGPDFSQISNHQNMGTLPPEWQPLELHELIPVAKKVLEIDPLHKATQSCLQGDAQVFLILLQYPSIVIQT